MKPLTIKVGTLAKIGLGIAAIDLASDVGKAIMFRSVEVINSKTADEMLEALDMCINSGKFHGLKKCRLKIVKGMCKATTKD